MVFDQMFRVKWIPLFPSLDTEIVRVQCAPCSEGAGGILGSFPCRRFRVHVWAMDFTPLPQRRMLLRFCRQPVGVRPLSEGEGPSGDAAVLLSCPQTAPCSLGSGEKSLLPKSKPWPCLQTNEGNEPESGQGPARPRARDTGA